MRSLKPAQVIALVGVFNRCLERKNEDNLNSPVHLGRFLEIVKKASEMDSFLGIVYVRLEKTLSPLQKAGLQNFQQILQNILPTVDPSRIEEMIEVAMVLLHFAQRSCWSSCHRRQSVV